MAKFRTHYDNLKVARNAPDSIIKAAYKTLCQTYHPDKFQGSKEEAERIMKIINASYAVLIDPVKREAHDAWIREQEEKTKQQSEKAHFGTTGNVTEQQYYQSQDEHDIPKTEDPFSSTDSDTYNKTTNEQWHHQKQNTQWKYNSPSEYSKGNTPTYSWRRYFARSIDYAIIEILIAFVFLFWLAAGYSLPSWVTAILFNPEISSIQQTLNWSLFTAFSWVMLEPIILSHFGTTPGKALFRLRLISDNNEPNYWGRSIAVWAVGMGCGIPFISLFTILNADARLKKKGRTDWDRWTGFKVEAEPLSIIRKIAITILLVVLLTVYAVADLVNKVSSNHAQNAITSSQESSQLTSETGSIAAVADDYSKTPSQKPNISPIKTEHSIQINNACREQVSVSITYWDGQDWLTKGWWNVAPFSRIETGLQTNFKDIYAYATSASYTWGATEGSGLARSVSKESYTSSTTNPLPASDAVIAYFLLASVTDNSDSSRPYYEFTLSCPSDYKSNMEKPQVIPHSITIRSLDNQR